jgi:hypothetical protein
MRFQSRLPQRLLALVVGLFAAALGERAAAEPAASAAVVARAVQTSDRPWDSFSPQAFAARVPAGQVWSVQLTPPKGELRYVSLRFADVWATARSGITIEVRDAGARLLATYDAAFLASNTAFSTGPLKPGPLRVSVRGPIATGDLRFRIDEMQLAPAQSSLLPQSLIPGLVIYSSMTPAQKKLARGVVLLTIAGREACTGFLVPGGRVVTAFHCLSGSDAFRNSAGQAVRSCADVTIGFDYVSEPYGGTANPRCKAVDPASPGATDDIAVLLLDGTPPGAPGRELTLAAGDPAAAEEVWVLEEPADLPVSAVRGCHVQGPPASPKFEHDCNTIGGASGSPILNLNDEVVGVHTDGFVDDGATPPQVVQAWYAACKAGQCPANKATLVSRLAPALR